MLSLSPSFSHLLKSSTRYSISCSAIFMALAASALLAMASASAKNGEKKEGEERVLLRIERASERKKNEKRNRYAITLFFVQKLQSRRPLLSLVSFPSPPRAWQMTAPTAPPPAEQQQKPKKKICCACPETKVWVFLDLDRREKAATTTTNASLFFSAHYFSRLPPFRPPKIRITESARRVRHPPR